MLHNYLSKVHSNFSWILFFNTNDYCKENHYFLTTSKIRSRSITCTFFYPALVPHVLQFYSKLKTKLCTDFYMYVGTTSIVYFTNVFCIKATFLNFIGFTCLSLIERSDKRVRSKTPQTASRWLIIYLVLRKQIHVNGISQHIS